METILQLPVPFSPSTCPACELIFGVLWEQGQRDFFLPPDYCPSCGKPMAPDAPALTTYHQLDPRWKDVKLGTGNTTIGRYGCVLCCMAMAAERATDVTLTPPQANELVKRANGFTGQNGNRFVWVAGGKALGLEYQWSVTWLTTPANLGQIIDEVDAGNYVLIQVDHDPSDTDVDEHWVLIREYIGDKKFLIDDPLTGDTQKFPPAYCKRGWDAGVDGVWSAARGIFKAVVYAWDGV